LAQQKDAATRRISPVPKVVRDVSAGGEGCAAVGKAWRSGEGAPEVLDQVADVLKTDRNPQNAVGDADRHERAGLQTTESGP
jgi:hypothetical protein